ncbi:MAG: precorrin-2 C(20)-methyltransferase [Desulfobacterales bacterium]|nr:precorrin-2 C(20)-methyltransferase [Desulfobacterales bacterium]
MNKKIGILYGIGVGPGDPELITIKSAKILNRVDVVFAASSTKNDYSLAVKIAKPYIPETASVRMLAFPMTTDQSEMETAWKDHAMAIVKVLEEGKDAAFLTLGDSMTYSTYSYILRHIKTSAPHITVKTIPGITSYQAAAACLNTPLVEGEESLLIVSGVRGGDRLRQLTGKPENVVFLKAYRNVKDINAAIDESKVFNNCVGISKCGHPDQEVIEDIKNFNQKAPDYWTLIIAKQKNENDI